MNKSVKVIKIKKLEAMIKEADKSKKIVKDSGIVWYETIKRLLKRLIAEARAEGENTVEVPVNAYEFIESMARSINVMSDLAVNNDKFHDATEKVLRRYTKATKWHKELNLTILEKKEFALMLAYMIENDLYCNDIDKKRRKQLEKLHGKHLNKDAYEEATDWACRKGYCEDRVSDTINVCIDIISPNCDDILKKKKKDKKAA